MKKTSFVLAASLLFASVVYAAGPNPTEPVNNCNNRCATLAERCSKGCNHPDNPGMTTDCLHRCGNQSTSCYVGCDVNVQHCAGEYSNCSRNAQDPSAKQNCVNAYHQCKGTGN